VGGCGISWAICKSAPRSRQITTPVPHHSVFTGRMPFLTDNKTETETKTVTGVLRCRRIQATAVDVCGCVSLDWPTRSARFYSTICVAAPCTWHRRSSTGPGMMIMIIMMITRPPNLRSHRRCERDFVLIPTHFHHATTLQLRAFA